MKTSKRQTNPEATAKAQEPIPQEQPAQDAPLPDTAHNEALQALETRLSEAETQRDEYLTMAQRVQADFDNFRRRNQSVRAEAFEDGAASFIKTILPVVDNLERALDAESSDEALCSGVKLVQKQLMEALEKRGVSVIDRVGQPFDPRLEDAVTQGTPEEGEPGTVAQVFLKGYQLGDQVLRHAMVKVIVA